MSRLALSDADRYARDWFKEITTSLGCSVKVDVMVSDTICDELESRSCGKLLGKHVRSTAGSSRGPSNMRWISSGHSADRRAI